MLTMEEIKKFLKEEKSDEPLGDGKAVFLSDMTEEEYEEYQHNVTNGWGGFNKKVKKIFKI